ncbi:hypothetical protein [Pseudoruegeria sp. HB172150]|uniref:COG4315 family predicted lipoprotein n=1 Tax=Pseudoruegeria sp. HB172150 TaxID=2721164 RepID=UPI0015543689|nr:hypothetical protein [Pseudoruegeria sp. HB172150]
MKIAALIAATALTLSAGATLAAGYGSNNGYGQNNGGYTQKQTTYVAPAPVIKILVDESGRTLYNFDNDNYGVSNCYGGCANDWPPYYAPANATPYGNYTVIQRNDGQYQWAYKGQPLYYWAGDVNPGDRNGDGIGGVWHVVVIK